MDVGFEQYYENDELKIYRGDDFIVSEYIKLHQPTLQEICEYGERNYYSMIYTFTATPQSLKAQLWKMDIDYTDITPYELFYKLIYRIYPQEKTSILFGDLDFTKFQIKKRIDNDSIVLYQEVYVGDIYNSNDEFLYHFSGISDASNFIGCDANKLIQELTFKNSYDNYFFKNIIVEPVILDEYTYGLITDYICKAHFIKRDYKLPANNSTKMILIEDAIEEMERNKNIEYHSQLKNLISSMINSEGFKYNHEQVWHMKINAFMDSVKRIEKISQANLLLQSGYSGFGIDLKNVDKKLLNWQEELD